MGLTLMADDRDLILGELVGGFKAIKTHLERQDAETLRAAAEREARRERDKQEAIAARERDKAELAAKLHTIEEKATQTYGMASASYRWVQEQAPPLMTRVDGIDKRVKAIEDQRTVSAAEERGSLKTWAWIGTIATAIGTAFATLLTYRDQIIAMWRGE